MQYRTKGFFNFNLVPVLRAAPPAYAGGSDRRHVDQSSVRSDLDFSPSALPPAYAGGSDRRHVDQSSVRSDLDFSPRALPPAYAGGSDLAKRTPLFFAILFCTILFSACTRVSEITDRPVAQAAPTPTPALHPPEKIDVELERTIAEIARAADG